MSETPEEPATADDSGAQEVNSQPGAPESQGAPETETTETDSQENPPAPDFNAIQNAGEQHAQEVSNAHDRLHTRLTAAYEMFSQELDKAYSVWENAVKDAKLIASAFTAREGQNNGDSEPVDPTRAR